MNGIDFASNLDQTSYAMADASAIKESQAHDLLRQKEWQAAIQLYDQLLTTSTTSTGNAAPVKPAKERLIAYLIGRTECQLELKLFDNLVGDCRRLLKLLLEADSTSTASRVRRRLIHGLYRLKRFPEAEAACRDWSLAMVGQPTTADMLKWLDRYRTVIQMANGQKSNQRISVNRLDEEMGTLDAKLETWATNNSCQDRFHRITMVGGAITAIKKVSNDATADVSVKSKDKTGSNENNFQKQFDQISLNNVELTPAGGSDTTAAISCTYCSLNFADRLELRAHCQTEQHQNVIMSDEGLFSALKSISRGVLKNRLLFVS